MHVLFIQYIFFFQRTMALWRKVTANLYKSFNCTQSLLTRLALPPTQCSQFSADAKPYPHSVAYEGGDLNEASLIGCVNKIKILKRQYDDNHYARCSILTAHTNPETAEEYRVSHWVYIFSPNLVKRVMRMRVSADEMKWSHIWCCNLVKVPFLVP